jgi:hypothetical protein
MLICSYPDCRNDAEFQCEVCKRHFCAMHTYQQGGYVCKAHFNEPAFKDPHAPRNIMADAVEILEQWIDRISGRRK